MTDPNSPNRCYVMILDRYCDHEETYVTRNQAQVRYRYVLGTEKFIPLCSFTYAIYGPGTLSAASN